MKGPAPIRFLDKSREYQVYTQAAAELVEVKLHTSLFLVQGLLVIEGYLTSVLVGRDKKIYTNGHIHQQVYESSSGLPETLPMDTHLFLLPVSIFSTISNLEVACLILSRCQRLDTLSIEGESYIYRRYGLTVCKVEDINLEGPKMVVEIV